MLSNTPSVLSKDSSYARRRQEHVSLINQLRAIGAQADLDLPRVAVIGNQSAGKSSLVEAISGITVPRDAGTCTRCPIECRMTNSSDAFSCQVFIRWEFRTDGSRFNEVREVAFGPRMTDKTDVELMLRRAQAAVLNRHGDIQKYVTMSLKDLRNHGANQLLFSPNAVCIDLSGPDLVDLAFVDLPGIIQNAEPEVVNMVEDLVSSHIIGNCIILVTLPMSDDIENQKAMRLAQKADPAGVRTIGVLTKPDTIPPGANQTKQLWLQVLDGTRFPLKLGYFCTRQPDEDERAAFITHSDARAAEAQFFADTLPWSTSARRDRFGTQNLVTALSGHLSRIIDESLPKLFDETKRLLGLCDLRLAEIPQAITSEPFTFVLNLINSFCAKTRTIIDGNIDAIELVQDTRKSYDELRDRIRATAPYFIPYDAVARGQNLSPDLLRLDDSEDVAAVSSTSRITLAHVRQKITDLTSRELPDNVPYAAKLWYIREFQHEWDNITRHTNARVYESLARVVRGVIRSHFSQYNHLEPLLRLAVDALLQLKNEDAKKQIAKLLKYESTAFTKNDHYLLDGKQKFLAQYKEMRAGKAAKNPFVADLPASQTLAANSKPHYASPGTQGVAGGPYAVHTDSVGLPNHFMSVCMASHLVDWSLEELRVTDYEDGRKPEGRKIVPLKSSSKSGAPASAGSSFGAAPATTVTSPALSEEDRSETLADVLEGLKKLGFAVNESDLLRLRPSDQYEAELVLMAEVRAYFKVAYKRVVDYVPLAIDHELLYAFADELQAHLIEALELSKDKASSRCAAYLAEDPQVVAERDDLLARKKRLLNVQAELLNAGV